MNDSLSLLKYRGRLILRTSEGRYQVYQTTGKEPDLSHICEWRAVPEISLPTIAQAKNAISHAHKGCCDFGFTEGFGGRKVGCRKAPRVRFE